MGFLANIANKVGTWLGITEPVIPADLIIKENPNTKTSTQPQQVQREVNRTNPNISTSPITTARATLIKELISNPAKLAQVKAMLAKKSDQQGINPQATVFDPKKISSPRIQVVNESGNNGIQKIIELKLDNGIKFVIAPDSSSNRVNMKAVYSVGSKDDKIAGTAHLLEHLLAGRTPYPSFAKGEDMDIVNFNGGIGNAATTTNSTWYDSFLPPELIELAFKIESERMKSANLDAVKDILPIEKAAVEQEIKKYEDQVINVTSNALNALMFKGTGYGHDALGTEESLRRISIDDLKNFYAQYSNPEKLTVVVSGNVGNPQQLEHLILKYFGDMQPTNADLTSNSKNLVQDLSKGSREASISKAGEDKVLALGFEMPHITDPDYAVIEALIYALLNSNTPILQKKLNEDKGLGIEMGWAPQLIHGKSAMQLLFKCNKFTDLEALRKEVKNIFETIADSGIGEEILAQVKQRWMINQYHKQENLDLKSVELAILSSFNACQLSVNLANNLQKVTNDDIKRIVRKYLTKDNEFAVYLKPSEEKNHDKTTTQDFKKQAERIIDPLRMQELTDSICGKQSPCIPKMDITKSAESGHTIICNENHNLPLMSLRIFSPRKPLSTKDQLKMQILRGILNQAGTQSYKAEELEKRINDIGAGFHFRDDADGFWFKIDSSTVGDNLKRCAELFKEFLLYNKLDLETFTKVKSAIKNSIKEENNNPEALAVREARDIIYPEGHFLHQGTRETRWQLVDSISYEEVMKFWQELKQGSFIITASGDTNQEQIKQYFDSTINQWTHSHNPNLNLNLPETHGADIQQLEGYEFKGDQEQAHVVLTQDCNINTTDTDYYPIRLANLILGAHPLSSRLGKLVRENSGLVYHIQSSLDNSTYHGGPFLVQAASKKSDAQKLLATIKQALSGFPDNITDKEIVLAKQILIRSFFIDWFKTNSNKASTLLDLELKNHDMNFIKNFAAMINSISREQIIDAFKKHINLSKLVEVVVDDKIKVNGQEVNTKFDAKEHKTKQSVALAA